MQYAIELEKVTKMYGRDRGVIDISLQVPDGSVFGFLGPNGAGKTTTISMLMNLTRPTSGKIIVFDEDNERHGLQNRSRIGYLAGAMSLDRGLTGRQQLEYFGHLRDSYNKDYVHELAERLNANLDKKIKSLSQGNRQKIGLIAALMHKPELLILDEPTSGLDPLIQAEFNKIIIEHKKAGKTAFISSHIMSEVQELCDELAIIREGKIVAQSSLEDLVAAAPREVRLTSDGSFSPADMVEDLAGVGDLSKNDHLVTFNYTGDINDLLTRLGKKQLKNVVIEDADLDDIFMSYYSDNDEGENNA